MDVSPKYTSKGWSFCAHLVLNCETHVNIYNSYIYKGSVALKRSLIHGSLLFSLYSTLHYVDERADTCKRLLYNESHSPCSIAPSVSRKAFNKTHFFFCKLFHSCHISATTILSLFNSQCRITTLKLHSLSDTQWRLSFQSLTQKEFQIFQPKFIIF